MKTFAFNLLPQKTKDEVQSEEKRDKTSVYTALLPLLAVLVWLLLVFVNGMFLSDMKIEAQTEVDIRQRRIDQEFLPVRIQHGELVIKTRSLADLIQLDIKPEILFVLVEDIFPYEESGVEIIGYGREDDGSFNISVQADSYLKFSEVVRRFSNYDGVFDVSISGVSESLETGEVTGSIIIMIDLDYFEEQKNV